MIGLVRILELLVLSRHMSFAYYINRYVKIQGPTLYGLLSLVLGRTGWLIVKKHVEHLEKQIEQDGDNYPGHRPFFFFIL